MPEPPATPPDPSLPPPRPAGAGLAAEPLPGAAGAAAPARQAGRQAARHELGGPTGPDPTRYGDWERAGRCIDF